ncbi:MAG: hypothetical protein WBZ42_06065 [Halobacteriota archaeon]
MRENELLSKLLHLCDLIKERIDVCVKSGELVPEKVEYISAGVREFDENERRPTHVFTNKTEKEVICNLKDEPVIEKWVEKLPEYEEILSEIEKHNRDKQEAIRLLDTFTYNISGFLFQGLKDEELTDLVKAFVKDIERKPPQWFFEIWINGIRLICDDSTECDWEIFDGLRIRRPVKSDFEFELESWRSSELTERRSSSDAILELSCEPKAAGRESEQELKSRVAQLITGLQLFRLGRVYILRSRSYAHWQTPFLLPTPLLSARLFRHNYWYALSEKEIPQLRDFIEKVVPLLPKKIGGQKPKEDDVDVPISIAAERFNDALIGLGSIEQQITSACMCLEALYLDDKTEVAHKLKLRVAKLLGLVGVEPIDVCRDLKHAYNIRSSFLHGSLIKHKAAINPPELAKRTIDHARRSLVIYLLAKQLLDEKGKLSDGKPLKKGLIKRIDMSMVDQHKCEELHQELRPFIEFLDKRSS